MAQQTAVEWFVQQLEEYGSDDFKIIFKKQFEQAKAMEKEQIMYAFNWAAYEQASNRELDLSAAEVYYNKKYKK
jgi:hypothetical protein